MARYTRSYGARRTSRRTTRRTAAPRGRYRAAPRRRITRRTTSRRRTSGAQTIRLVIDTGQHSGASLGPTGMVKPAPAPRNGRFA